MTEAAPREHLIRCCSRCRAIYRKDVTFCPSDGGELELSARDPLIGTTLEHYVIDDLLGEGAMGRVYRAHHATLVDKQFAVKVLLGDLASTPEMRTRFVNEAKSAGRLAHPNVVSVVDFGRSEAGLIYLVMELVDGVPLSTLIDDHGPLAPQRVAKLARGIAEGLRHAHELGLVHRDLKPENVMVVAGPDGELARVVDFGIALSIDRSDVRLTSTGMAMGTPAYVAPEQVSGTEVDPRADQYALGVTLYEALTGGNLPFTGDPVDVVAAKVGNEPPPLAERMPEGQTVPPGLARIVEKMVARKPRQRFDDLGEVIAALDRWMTHRGVDTDVVSRSPRKHRGPTIAVIAAAAVAAGVVVWSVTRAPATHTEVASVAPPPAPTPSPPPAPTPTPTQPVTPPPAPTETETVPVETVPVETSTRPSSRRPSRSKKVAQATTTTRPKVPPPTTTPAVVTAPPVVAPTTTTPPAAIALQARLLRVDVQGSLSQAVIQSAVERVRPAIERCTSRGAPHTVKVEFTIDESKRAHGVRGSGTPQASVDCVVGALGGVRTDTAPDTGDADVVVRIAFGARS